MLFLKTGHVISCLNCFIRFSRSPLISMYVDQYNIIYIASFGFTLPNELNAIKVIGISCKACLTLSSDAKYNNFY